MGDLLTLKPKNWPIVGRVFVWETIGFSYENVRRVAWFLETLRLENVTWVEEKSGLSLAIFISEEMHKRRLKTLVELKNGHRFEMLSWPAMKETEFPPSPNELSGTEASNYLKNQIEILTITLNKIRSEKQEFNRARGIDMKLEIQRINQKRLEDLEKLISERELDLRMRTSEFSQMKMLFAQEKERFAREVKTTRQANEAMKSDLVQQLQAFNDETNLRLRIKALQDATDQLLIEWDIFARANQLGVRLTPETKERISEIVNSALLERQREKKIELSHRQLAFSNCPICGQPSAPGMRCRDGCFEYD